MFIIRFEIFCRYSYITPEYIIRKPANHESPDSEWMISRCEHGPLDSEIIEKCENPKFDTSFQSLIPVTDTVTGVIYKNTYCTQCNKVNEAALKSWGFRIGCDETLHFPARDMLLLEMYSTTSMARTLMARLPRLFRTHF